MIRELSEHEINALHHELLIKDIVAAAEKLAPFPDIAWKVSNLVKAMAPVREIEELIKYDQAITAKILRLGNSACYGRQYGTRSLKEAILVLGNKRLIQAVITACASAYFGGGASREHRLLWEHSVTSALMSEIAARRLNYNGVLTLYSAALLHDIGETVLSIYFSIYRKSGQSSPWDRGDVILSQRRALGIDHQELGGIIARNWKFPAEIAVAIEHHHNPEKAGQYGEITSLVYLADLMAALFQERNAKPLKRGIDPESDPVLKKLSITRKMIDDFQVELGTGMKEVMEALGPG